MKCFVQKVFFPRQFLLRLLTGLVPGSHALRAAALAAGLFLTVSCVCAGTPFMEDRFTVTGTIEFEHFDRGGTDWDLDALANTVFRNSDADISVADDLGGGFAVSHCISGEFVEYSIRVATNGTYNLDVRAKTSGYGCTLTYDFTPAGQSLPSATLTANLPSCPNWTTVTAANTVSLNAGDYTVRVTFSNIYTGQYAEAFNYFTLYLAMPAVTTGSTNLNLSSPSGDFISHLPSGVPTALVAGESGDRKANALGNARLIQAAVDYVGTRGGGTITFPTGLFLVCQNDFSTWMHPNEQWAQYNFAIWVKNNAVKLQGSGAGTSKTTLKALYRSTTILWVGNNDSINPPVTVSDFSIDNIVLLGNPRVKYDPSTFYSDGSKPSPVALPTVEPDGTPDHESAMREGLVYDYTYKPTGQPAVNTFIALNALHGSLMVLLGQPPANNTFLQRIRISKCDFVDPSVRGILMGMVKDVAIEGCTFTFFDITTSGSDSGLTSTWYDLKYPDLGAHVGILTPANWNAENVRIVTNTFNGNCQIATAAAVSPIFYAADGLAWIGAGGNIKIADNTIVNYGLEGIQVNCGPATVVRNQFTSYSTCLGSVALCFHPTTPGHTWRDANSIYNTIDFTGNDVNGGTRCVQALQPYATYYGHYNLVVSGNKFVSRHEDNFEGNTSGVPGDPAVDYNTFPYNSYSTTVPASGLRVQMLANNGDRNRMDTFLLLYKPDKALISGNTVNWTDLGMQILSNSNSDTNDTCVVWLLSNKLTIGTSEDVYVGESKDMLTRLYFDSNQFSRGAATCHLYLWKSQNLISGLNTPASGRLFLNDRGNASDNNTWYSFNPATQTYSTSSRLLWSGTYY